jgi:hypothetical protein
LKADKSTMDENFGLADPIGSIFETQEEFESKRPFLYKLPECRNRRTLSWTRKSNA